MIREQVDILVLGAGFAGSLTALLLRQLGRRVLLADRFSHPRFAIGESSTPLADLALADLARRYDLPQLSPLAHYGSWCRRYPHLMCGPKRGFSYFLHRPERDFATDVRHGAELLVAASHSDETADTNWLRADVDHFLARQAEQAGAIYWDQADLKLSRRARGLWTASGRRDDAEVAVDAELVVDATGPAALVARAAEARLETDALLTRSHCLYAHLAGLPTWESQLRQDGIDVGDYPFECDRAALHHVLDEGWMWQLRFDNEVTSVGLVFDGPAAGEHSPQQLWQSHVARYPSLSRQLARAELAAPEGGLQQTARLQRRWTPAAGEDWVLLPGTAGFVDPLHSTGIAHSLFGIERLVRCVEQCWGRRQQLAEALSTYARTVDRELMLIDHLVAACYGVRRRFPAFVAATMLYFAAATTCERRRLEGGVPHFLSADDEQLFRQFCQLARRLAAAQDPAADDRLIAEVKQCIQPWNHVGLLADDADNMYRYTAVP